MKEGFTIEKLNVEIQRGIVPHLQWRRYATRTLIVSQASFVLALALYVAGAAIYFADFSFGSGGDTRGSIMMVGAVCFSIVALVGAILCVLFSLIAWRCAGSPWWLALAISLPAIELAAIVLVVRTL